MTKEQLENKIGSQLEFLRISGKSMVSAVKSMLEMVENCAKVAGELNAELEALAVISNNGEEVMYYVQDSRTYVGNSVLWWALERKGYTTDISEAHQFTITEVEEIQKNRKSDKAWPCGVIDMITKMHVDMQDLRGERKI